MLVINKPSAQPALKRAIQTITPNMPLAAARAKTTLDTLIENICTSPHQNAWEFSPLNKNGFPVEFTFTSQDDAIRYTTEIAPPEVAPIERLSHAKRLLTSLGVQLPETVIANFPKIQESGSLDWGTWIGVRHRQESDRYKLYIQVPEPTSTEATQMIRQFLGDQPLLPGDAAVPVAIGQELGSSRTEFYFRIKHLGLEYWEIGYLLRRVGLGSQQVELLS